MTLSPKMAKAISNLLMKIIRTKLV